MGRGTVALRPGALELPCPNCGAFELVFYASARPAATLVLGHHLLVEHGVERAPGVERGLSRCPAWARRQGSRIYVGLGKRRPLDAVPAKDYAQLLS